MSHTIPTFSSPFYKLSFSITEDLYLEHIRTHNISATPANWLPSLFRLPKFIDSSTIRSPCHTLLPTPRGPYSSATKWAHNMGYLLKAARFSLAPLPHIPMKLLISFTCSLILNATRQHAKRRQSRKLATNDYRPLQQSGAAAKFMCTFTTLDRSEAS